MKRLLATVLIGVLFLVAGCSSNTSADKTLVKKPELKAVTVYQNKNIHGFKISPDGTRLLVIIDNAIVIYDLKKMKPIIKKNEKGLKFAPEDILWSPDSKMATIIFTGDINRMIFIDLKKSGQVYDLYARNLVDLSWANNKSLLYKVNNENEAIFRIEVFSKEEPTLLTALRPDIEQAKMLLINGYHGFILKKDDQLTAVNADALNKPNKLADLNFRNSKGFLNRSVLLKDKNEDGLLLKKYGYVTVKGKTVVLNNDLIFLNLKGETLTLPAKEGRLLSEGIALQKEDGLITLYDLQDKKERALPGAWQDYTYKLQNDYWKDKKAVLLKQKLDKNGRPIQAIMLYQLK